jgi:hypothetical protein
MNCKTLLGTTLVCICAILSGCGGSDESSTEVQAEQPTPAKKANNPLASQQNALNQARALKVMVDAETKKKEKQLEAIKN